MPKTGLEALQNTLLVVVLTLKCSSLYAAIILLTVGLLNETKALWHSFAFGNSELFFSARLQIQHEM